MSDLELLKERFTDEREARKAADNRLNTLSSELSDVRNALHALGSLVAGNPNPILQFDQRGVVQFSNPAAIKQWGSDVAAGAFVQETFPFVKEMDFADLIEYNSRLQLLARKKGEYFRFVFSGDAVSELVSLYCLDVTEYEKEKLELQKAHEESEELLTSLSSVLIGINRSGNIILWNKTAEKLFGIKEVEVLGRPLEECDIEWDIDRIQQLVGSCQEFVSFYEDKIYFKRQDGVDGTLEVVLTPVAKNHQRRAGVFLLARDITDFALMDGAPDSTVDIKALALKLSAPIHQVAENLQFLEKAITQISDVIEKNLVLLSVPDERDLLDKHLVELGETIQKANIEHVLEELPQAVGETISMVLKVSDFLSNADSREKVA